MNCSIEQLPYLSNSGPQVLRVESLSRKPSPQIPTNPDETDIKNLLEDQATSPYSPGPNQGQLDHGTFISDDNPVNEEIKDEVLLLIKQVEQNVNPSTQIISDPNHSPMVNERIAQN